MVEDTLLQALELPYSVFAGGAYTPPCEEERNIYGGKLNILDKTVDPQVRVALCLWLEITFCALLSTAASWTAPVTRNLVHT